MGKTQYDADSITVLEGLEAVRKRPGMYIGSVGTKGLNHLIYEIVDNAVDEHLAGYCDTIKVTLEADGSATVEDNGRGIPVGMHEKGISAERLVFTTLHAGGKFDNSAYKTSGGLHGVGSSVVNALSTRLTVRVKSGGCIYEDHYERGIPVMDLVDGLLPVVGKTRETGTTINFLPDDTIFDKTRFKEDEVKSRLHETAYLNPKLTIIFEDKRKELKENSIRNKQHMMEKHIVPYFGTRKMNEITPADVIQWQNTIQEKDYSKTYERMIQNQLNALFNHAQKIYNLKENPCKKVKKMGKSDANKLEFWTKAEYDRFIAGIEPGSEDYLIFEILFWTGIREGELLALSLSDFDMSGNLLHINKTYNRIRKRDVIDTPKTENSVRTIDIPNFLKEEVQEYSKKHYGFPEDQRLFPIVARALQKRLKKYEALTGVKSIRVHDIRHSHVAYLIYQGVEPLIIKERLGHKDIQMTLNTYGHLYPSQQKKVAEMLDNKR